MILVRTLEAIRSLLPQHPAGQIRFGALMAASVAAAVVWTTPFGTAAQDVPVAKLWPPFTMTYSIYMADWRTGDVVLDQTHRLSVKSEYEWRDETVQSRVSPPDAGSVNPNEVGSYTELKDGVLHQYDAYKVYASELKLSSRAAVTPVNRALDPTLFPQIQDAVGAGRGWTDAAAAPQGTVGKHHSETVSCQRGACTSEETVNFDAASINLSSTRGVSAPIGGIAVSAERRLDGKLVSRFEAESLQLGAPGASQRP